MFQIHEYHQAKEYGSKEELLMLQDDLDDQLHKRYQDMFQEVDNTLFWYYHPDYIDYLDPPGAGARN